MQLGLRVAPERRAGMLRREEDADVQVPAVDRSNPDALLDIRGGLPLPTAVHSEACELRRPSRTGREAFASASERVHPDKDSVARELLEAAKESEGMDGGRVRSCHGNDE
jgi:hypothetical protein